MEAHRFCLIHKQYFNSSYSNKDFLIAQTLTSKYDDDFLLHLLEQARKRKDARYWVLPHMASMLKWPLEPDPVHEPVKPLKEIMQRSKAGAEFFDLYSKLGTMPFSEWEEEARKLYPTYDTCMDEVVTPSEHATMKTAYGNNYEIPGRLRG